MKSSGYVGRLLRGAVYFFMVFVWAYSVRPVFADVNVRECVLGMRQRESSMIDISYRLNSTAFSRSVEGDAKHLGADDVQWRRKGQRWMWRRFSTDPDDKGRLLDSEGYNGLNIWSFYCHKSGRVMGEVERKPQNQSLLSALSGEEAYLTFSGRLYSEIVEEGDFVIEKSDDGIWLKGKLSQNSGIAFLVDKNKDYMPVTIIMWMHSFGHSFEQPTQSYRTLESEESNGVWMPVQIEFVAHPLQEGDATVVQTMKFTELEVNSGMTDEEFEPQWPKGARITDRVICIRYTAGANEDEDVADGRISSLDGDSDLATNASKDEGVDAIEEDLPSREPSAAKESVIADDGSGFFVRYVFWLIAAVIAVLVILGRVRYRRKPAG